MTALAEKFAEKGIMPRNVALQIAISDFMNNGGTFGVAYAMLCAAYGRGSKANLTVPNGQRVTAGEPHPDDDAGQKRSADKANSLLPASSPPQCDSIVGPPQSAGLSAPQSGAPEDDAGQPDAADQANECLPASSPRFLPGHSRRGAASIAAVQETVARSLFDSVVLPDGRRLREVRWCDCPGLARRYRKMSRILMMIHGRGVPPEPDATVDAVVSEAGLREILSNVEKFNDVI